MEMYRARSGGFFSQHIPIPGDFFIEFGTNFARLVYCDSISYLCSTHSGVYIVNFKHLQPSLYESVDSNQSQCRSVMNFGSKVHKHITIIKKKSLYAENWTSVLVD